MDIRHCFGIVCFIAFFLIGCESLFLASSPPLTASTVEIPKMEDPGPLPAPNEPDKKPPVQAPRAFLVHADPPDATWVAAKNPRSDAPMFVKKSFDATIMLIVQKAEEGKTAAAYVEYLGGILGRGGIRLGPVSSDSKANSASADLTGKRKGVPTSGKAHVRVFTEQREVVLVLGFWPTKNSKRVALDFGKVVKSLRLER